MTKTLLLCLGLFISVSSLAIEKVAAQIIHFPSGELTLGGELFLPAGKGPFPAILFNHGSAPGMKNSWASKALGKAFIKEGWAFFMPYRRGQGLSANQGPYILDKIKTAGKQGMENAVNTLIKLHQNEHLSDQVAAFAWLQKQDFVQTTRIATIGNSFGGIQVVLGMEKGWYCAGINASGAAQSWNDAKPLQAIMKRAVGNSEQPIFFLQAENDYDLTPSYVLSAHMQKAGKTAQLKIYPAFGSSAQNGHSLLWAGVSIWFDDGLAFVNRYCPAAEG